MKAHEFLAEYELSSNNVIPGVVFETNIIQSKYNKYELGNLNDYRVVLYISKLNQTGFTFITISNETVGHIEHKIPSVPGRLALSNIRKKPGSGFQMLDVLRLLLRSHSLESDNTNTVAGAHRLLMRLVAAHPNCHVEDGEGNIIPIDGNLLSPENQAKYSVSKSDPNFLDDDRHLYLLVFEK
jgi:hypothetical protein